METMMGEMTMVERVAEAIGCCGITGCPGIHNCSTNFERARAAIAATDHVEMVEALKATEVYLDSYIDELAAADIHAAYSKNMLAVVRSALAKSTGEEGSMSEPVLGQWRPISTVPDGLHSVLISDGHNVGEGFWHDGTGCHRAGPGWFWEMDRGDLLTAKNAYVTHWMPLPPPPQPAGLEQGEG